MNPVEFLHQAWGQVAEPGDYVFLSTRNPESKKGWTDSFFQYDNSIKGRVRDWLRQNDPRQKDVYFCPLPFSQPERLAKYVKPVNILWSDVDDGDPKKLRPTVLWESSPNRHHALWFLKDRLHAEDAADLNKSVTYFCGADKGGWDLSQVLRIPGTFNHKYDFKPQVKLIHWDKKLLDANIIASKVKHTVRKFDVPEVSNEDASAILKNYRLSSKVLSLLLGEAEHGKRSEVLWYLENKLMEAGMNPEEVLTVIKESDWNKFKGRADEDDRLRNEIGKIIEKNIDEAPRNRKAVQAEGFNLQTFEEVMSSLQSSPGWCVKDFWMRSSHGIVSGEPKSFKSTLVMDLCLSVASGAPFLGQYEVENGGPVLYIQNENSEWIMKDRFEKMVKNKGLGGKINIQNTRQVEVTFPKDIPFHMLNQQGFMLSDEDHQDFLEETIKEMRPALVVLDPLYLMFDGDIASAQELFPLLQWLLYLKNEYQCGIIIIHHWNKGGESKRGGQRMLGSTTLHGWVESAWYLKSVPHDEGDEGEVIMEREFRGAGIKEKLDLRIKMGDVGDSTYDVKVENHVPQEETKPGTKRLNPETATVDLMTYMTTRKSGCSEAQLTSATGYNAKQVRETIDLMIKQGSAYRESGRVHLKH